VDSQKNASRDRVARFHGQPLTQRAKSAASRLGRLRALHEARGWVAANEAAGPRRHTATEPAVPTAYQMLVKTYPTIRLL
jgi:hypothetical protein